MDKVTPKRLWCMVIILDKAQHFDTDKTKHLQLHPRDEWQCEHALYINTMEQPSFHMIV